MQQFSTDKDRLLRSPSSNNSSLTRTHRSHYGAAESNELNTLLLGIVTKPHFILESFIEDVLINHLENKPRDPLVSKTIAHLKQLKNKITPIKQKHAPHYNHSITAEDIAATINNLNIYVKTIKLALDSDIFDKGANFNLSELDEKLHKQIIDHITDLQKTLHEDSVNPGSLVSCCAGTSLLIVFLWACGTVINILSWALNFTDSPYACYRCITDNHCTPPSADEGISTLRPTSLQVLLYVSHISSLITALSVAWLPTIRVNKLNFTDHIKHLTVERLSENNTQVAIRILATSVLNRALMGILSPLMTAYAIYRAIEHTYFSSDQFYQFINCTSVTPNPPPIICDGANRLCTVNTVAASNRFIDQWGNGIFIFGLGTLCTIYTIYAALVFAKFLISKINQLYNSYFEATIPPNSAQAVRITGVFAKADDLEARQTRAERTESINADSNSFKMVELPPPLKSVPKISQREIADLNNKCGAYSANPF